MLQTVNGNMQGNRTRRGNVEIVVIDHQRVYGFVKVAKQKSPRHNCLKWTSTNGRYQLHQTTRCDPCTEKHEAEEERMRQSNQAHVMKQTKDHLSLKPMVTFCCVECATQKEVDMNNFWQRTKDERNRFREVKCSCCQTFKRLGKWLRRPHETYNSIEKWLKHNNTYDSKIRHATMTIDLFCTQYIGEGLLGATDMESAAVTKDVSITPDNNNDSSPKEQRKQVKRPLPEVNNDDI